MKIDPLKHANNIQKYNKTNKVNNEKKVNVNKDKVDISKDYSIYEKAVNKLKELDKLDDVKKLDAIAEKIRNNEYKIDSKEIAEKIIEKTIKNNKE